MEYSRQSNHTCHTPPPLSFALLMAIAIGFSNDRQDAMSSVKGNETAIRLWLNCENSRKCERDGENGIDRNEKTERCWPRKKCDDIYIYILYYWDKNDWTVGVYNWLGTIRLFVTIYKYQAPSGIRLELVFERNAETVATATDGCVLYSCSDI